MTIMTAETKENIDGSFMKCMVCEMPTVMAFRKKDIEAAFCTKHIPEQRQMITIALCINIR
ncbi:MAG: hypothetical protein HY514_03505 [Candidatus Aenigmarchaeota archaeon]|nr:hypothetical protein [Candidatus Aenigmarchaeota archaeon]